MRILGMQFIDNLYAINRRFIIKVRCNVTFIKLVSYTVPFEIKVKLPP